MKGRQMSMTALEDYDRAELEREHRETRAMINRLDQQYGRMDYRKVRAGAYPKGSVVIIAQNLFRNSHYTWHFYRTVLNYASTCNDPQKAVFVQADNGEWPDIPPWAETVGHEGELKDIDWCTDMIHWATGEVVEPIATWWMKRWEMEA